MAAVRQGHSLRDKIVRAEHASNEVLLFSNIINGDSQLRERVRVMSLEAIRDGHIAHERIRPAHRRIAKKRQLTSKINIRGVGS